MLLNNKQIIEEIKKEIKICIETNENENTTIFQQTKAQDQMASQLNSTKNLEKS